MSLLFYVKGGSSWVLDQARDHVALDRKSIVDQLYCACTIIHKEGIELSGLRVKSSQF